MDKSEGSSSSGNAAFAAIGVDSESDGVLKRMIIGGTAACRAASSKAAAPIRATLIGFGETGDEGDGDPGRNEDEGDGDPGRNEDEGDGDPGLDEDEGDGDPGVGGDKEGEVSRGRDGVGVVGSSSGKDTAGGDREEVTGFGI